MDNVAKVDVVISPDISKDGEVITLPADVLYDKMQEAGWSEDPGTGKAILTPLGNEIVSPRPVAPPIGYVAEESIMERLEKLLAARIAQLGDTDVIEETEEEMEDFETEDLEDVRWSYTVKEMVYEAPALPGSSGGKPVEPVSKEEAAKAALEARESNGDVGS